MQIITDQVEIFSILEDFGQADFNPNQSCVRIFHASNKMGMLIFCHAGNAKGAHLFLLSIPEAPFEIESKLLPEIFKLEGDQTLVNVRDEALDNIRILIEEKKSESRFFDAH